MKSMRIITTICWIISAIALIGLAIWFMTGSIFGIGSGGWRSESGINWGSGISISGWDVLSGPFNEAGVYTPGTEGVNSLKIDWIDSEVTVRPHDGNDFKITEFAQRELEENEKLKISTSGGTLTVKFCENGRIRRMPRKKLEVLIPRVLSENLNGLYTDTASGTVLIDNIKAGTLEVNTISGGAQISNIVAQTFGMDSASGTLTVKTVQADDINLDSISGAIHISDSAAKTLNCNTASGRIDVYGAFDDASLESISGRISIDNSASRSTVGVDTASGAQELSGAFEEVKADSISGSISVRSTVVPDSLSIDTTSGSVTITVPKGDSLTVSHSSTSGKLSSDIPIITQGHGAKFRISTTSGSTRIMELE